MSTGSKKDNDIGSLSEFPTGDQPVVKREKIVPASREPFDAKSKRLSGIEQANPNLDWEEIKKQQANTITSPTKPTSGKNWRQSEQDLKMAIEEQRKLHSR